VFLPVGEVVAAEAVVERLVFVGGGECGVDVVFVLEEVEFGVGVVAGEDGVSGGLDHEGEDGGEHFGVGMIMAWCRPIPVA